MKITCQCGQPIEFPDQMAGEIFKCPGCEKTVLLMPKVESSNLSLINKTAGPVAVFFYLVALGFLLPFGMAFVASLQLMAHTVTFGSGLTGMFLAGFGLVIGIFFAACGASLRRCTCGNCGNTVNSKSKLCPACKVAFSK